MTARRTQLSCSTTESNNVHEAEFTDVDHAFDDGGIRKLGGCEVARHERKVRDDGRRGAEQLFPVGLVVLAHLKEVTLQPMLRFEFLWQSLQRTNE